MRNREIQRWLKRNSIEKPLTIRDETGMLDPTAYEAVLRIVKDEKKALIARYFAAIHDTSIILSQEDEQELQTILNTNQKVGNRLETTNKDKYPKLKETLTD